MSKKLIIIGIVLLIVLLGGAGGYFLFNRSNQDLDDESFVSDLNSGVGLPSASRFNDPLISHEDESGYSFSYPDTLNIKDVTPEDDNFYSSLELSKGTDLTKVDITVGNIDPYKTNKSASLVGSTTLGGITANQYSLNGRIVLTAIDQGVLYVIDSPKDGGFWEDAQSKIVSSFKFAGQVTTTTGSGGDSDANTSYEEETVE